MKKVNPEHLENNNNPDPNEEMNEPYEIIYASPRDEEIHLKILKRAQLNAHMARWFWDHEYNQLLWSDGVFEILEIDPRKHGANFKTFMDVIHPEDKKIREKAQSDLKTTKGSIEITYRLLMADGSIKWINEIFNTDFDKNGKAIRSFGTIQEITKYKLSEENFRQNEDRFKKLIEAIPAGVAIVQDQKISFINPSGKKLLFGNNKLNPIGRRFESFIDAQSEKKYAEEFEKLTDRNAQTTFEIQMQSSEGLKFTAEITLIATNYINRKAVQIIFSDITEQKLSENRIKEKENKFRDLIENKDKFFSLIAHDIRTPVNSLIAFLDLLDSEYDKFSDSEKRKYIKLMHNNANKTLNLLDNLIEWAKSESGNLSFHPVDLNLFKSIKSILELFESALAFKQISIQYQINENLMIWADKNMFRTIMQNLLSNAIKYSYHGGTILISAIHKAQFIEIKVKDNGIGMSKKTIDKLFTLEKIDSQPGTSEERGSGLGLILCKDFVDWHHWTIKVKSEINKGSQIIIRIPVF